jgi:putative toxin-antitoxin system antitoxin component (TIGR02293 family)
LEQIMAQAAENERKAPKRPVSAVRMHTAHRSRRASAAEQWVLKRNAFLESSFRVQLEEINRGASACDLIGAAEVLQVPRERLYELLGLSISTAKRKVASNVKLDPCVTERLMQIGGVEKLAEDVFGDRDRASEWLKTNNISLGDVAPLSLLGTEIGRREVLRILNAIAYGGAA